MVKRFFAIGTGVAMILFVAGLVIAGSPLVFPHKVHLKEGLVCANCHSGDRGMETGVNRDVCADCHDGDMEGWHPEVMSRKLGIPFPHAKHSEAVECGACHASVLKDSVTQGKSALGPESCFSCHPEYETGTGTRACGFCHGTDMAKIKPSDHKMGWLKRHGREAEWSAFNRHGRECRACHRAGACVACHRNQRPDDHNGFWRLRAHGKAAEWDRDRCRTCHETGWCIRCHRDTRPLNHTGSWSLIHGKALGGLGSTDCRTCHDDVWCSQCHALRR